jgi:hypothetical protein
MDPLIRNLNNNKDIEGVSYSRRISAQHKISAYADDISIICKENRKSISNIFVEYQRLTNKSGLELNAEKTEILRLSTAQKCKYKFTYLNEQHNIENVEEIKICGIFFSYDTEREKILNVHNKIRKLECKLKPWSKRGLTLEGKILIVKTFGLSQLIYNMQCFPFDDESLTEIEKKIFNFIWSNQNSAADKKSIDRIKRSVLKNEYENGGLRATDVDALDRSLKMKQYIRASSVDHPIRHIQQLCTKNVNMIQQEYGKCSSEDTITERAQSTINILTDHNRISLVNEIEGNEYESFDNATINQIASINVKHFLQRKGRVFVKCIFANLPEEPGTLLDVVRLAETERERRKCNILEMILGCFPGSFRQIALCYNDDINETTEKMEAMRLVGNNWVEVENLTVKMLQKNIKIAMNKVTELNVNSKVGINNFDNNNFIIFRKHCQNIKLRSIFYRMANNDFFSKERMHRFKMIHDNSCLRCNDVETTKHMLWECADSKKNMVFLQ